MEDDLDITVTWKRLLPLSHHLTYGDSDDILLGVVQAASSSNTGVFSRAIVLLPQS